MHVHFVGQQDDNISVSSLHSQALAACGITVSFDDCSTTSPESPRDADVIHVVTEAQHDHALFRRLCAARKNGQAIFRWWTSRDVLWAKYHLPARKVAHALTHLGAVQGCAEEQLVEELSGIGVSATLMPRMSLRLRSTIEPAPLPQAFTVLTYLPTARRIFHGSAILDELIHRLPDVRFLILGDSGTDYSHCSNVESLGFVDDVSRAIRRATVLVQPRLDGLPSRLAFEMLCQGRHAVGTAEVPFCQRAQSLDDFITSIRQIQRDAAFNLEGREYVCVQFEWAKSVDVFRRTLDECTSPGRLQLKLSGQLQVAAVFMRYPALFGRKPAPPLDSDSLPSTEHALRSLLFTEATRAATTQD